MQALRMTAQNYLLIGTLLAGFSFSVVAQLLVMDSKRKIAALMMNAFIISSLMLLVGTMLVGMTVVFASHWGENQAPIDFVERYGSVMLTGLFLVFIGFAFLIVGINLAGWMHAQATGIISTLVTTILIIVLAFSLAGFR